MANNVKARAEGTTQTGTLFPTTADAVSHTTTTNKRRNYPNLPLEQALVVARAIQDGASGVAVSRISMADLGQRSPDSSIFRDLLQASRFYGLTTGGVHALRFELTPLGDAATGADEDKQQQARRQAVLSIEPYKTFFTELNGKKIPGPGVCKEILTTKAKVPAERADECMRFMLADARFVGFIRKAQAGGEYIELNGTSLPIATTSVPQIQDDEDDSVAVMEPPVAAEPQHRLSVVPKHG